MRRVYRAEDSFGNVHYIVVDGDFVWARNGAGVRTMLANYASSRSSLADGSARVRNAALTGVDALNAVCRDTWEIYEGTVE